MCIISTTNQILIVICLIMLSSCLKLCSDCSIEIIRYECNDFLSECDGFGYKENHVFWDFINCHIN